MSLRPKATDEVLELAALDFLANPTKTIALVSKRFGTTFYTLRGFLIKTNRYEARSISEIAQLKHASKFKPVLHLIQAGNSVSTACKLHSCNLKLFLNWCKVQGLLSALPAKTKRAGWGRTRSKDIEMHCNDIRPSTVFYDRFDNY